MTEASGKGSNGFGNMQQPTPNYTLLTDLYQLTMAYGYWRSGTATKEAVFHLYFRSNSFGSAFSLAAGLEQAIHYLQNFRFDSDATDYLVTLRGNDGQPLFAPEFLEYLRNLRPHCDIDAVPEGTPVFPNEPLLRVQGPIIEAQLLETTLLNLINFQTLIATKASRVCWAARGDTVLEFGLRRAQGPDGGISASRAAYIGGCHATSNVMAGKLFGIPVKGTHAHSWVMSFDNELEAFEEYAKAMPGNAVFLVDTYNSLEGVRRAVVVGRRLRERGYEMSGIRLDSGDLAPLSIEARRILDEGGFPQAFIVASNDLDEHAISELKARGAKVNVWGVGTKLATAYDQPALGGVYKLSAIREPGEQWIWKVKRSENPSKSTAPGVQQVRRFLQNGSYVADAIYDSSGPTPKEWGVVSSATEPAVAVPSSAEWRDLLVPIYRRGELVYSSPSTTAIRSYALSELQKLPLGSRDLIQPAVYRRGWEWNLHQSKMELLREEEQFRAR